MGNMCGSSSNYGKTDYIIISETARYRFLVRPEEAENCQNSPPEYRCLIENYKEAGGINTILEDAIFFYSNLVEHRCSTGVRLKGICPQSKNDLQNCYNEHHDCSFKCMDEVEAFVTCVNQQRQEIEASKIKLKEHNKKRKKIERELSAKYKI